jgi:predicted RND superfamily exporter protein
VFVAVDKWKNARLDYPKASTEFIAAVALPDAAGAMFLTTLTTSIAFFATSICPVAPVKMFAIFCGLLIMLDYIMCVLLIFPTLCIYDKALQAGRANCCISISCCRRNQPQGEGDEIDETTEEKPSLIRRILFGYYNLLHKARWGLFIICFAALAVSAYYATTLDLPVTLDVRLLDETNQFEQNYRWRQKLLNDVLVKSAGSNAYAFWGITPADTGDHCKLKICPGFALSQY